MPSTGTTVGLGQTRRKGLDIQLTSCVGDRLTLWASHALQEARVVSACTASGVSLAGTEVFSTPRYISNAGAEYLATDTWRLNLQARAQGSYYIDDLNARGKYGGFVLWDVGARHHFSKVISVDLQVRNLADRKYEYVWFDNFFWPTGSEQPMYSPGPGRSAWLSLNGVVVIDVRTGEILALANTPTYNPNNREGLSGAQLRNRALTDTFEPGSTLKPFTIALGLESGKCDSIRSSTARPDA